MLSQYMADVDRFRSVMRTTRNFIIGDFTIAFFTGDNLPNYRPKTLSPTQPTEAKSTDSIINI